MKAFVITVMLIALFLLYRIAFPKHVETKKGNDIPVKRETNTDDVVVKRRYVCPAPGQPQPTPATALKSENQTEKADIFAAGNENRTTVIPSEKLDEVFGTDPNPDDLDIPPDDDPDESEAEEAEELRGTLGGDARLADGFTYEEMATAIDAVNNPSEETEKEAARVLSGLEKTDMFEQLVSSDAGRALRINAVLDHYEQSVTPESANVDSDKDLEDFDIMNFLS
jgi:hypothetical protein